MKRRSLKFALVLPGLVLAAGAVWWLVRAAEPSFQGKTVTAWLKEFNSNSGEASQAMKALGEKALPGVIRELRVKDSSFKQKFYELARKQSVIKIAFTQDTLRRDRAIQACAALGPAAKPAIPALGEALGYGSGRAAQVLEKFGPEAIEALATALTNAPGCSPPYATAGVLGRMGVAARMAVTNLAWEFENYSVGYPRHASAVAMGAICQELIEKAHETNCQEVVIAKTVLIRGLINTNWGVRRAAADALARFKANAQEATGALVKLLVDSQLEVRQSATNALMAIDPRALARTGVKA